jgi:hypothetical protein
MPGNQLFVCRPRPDARADHACTPLVQRPLWIRQFPFGQLGPQVWRGMFALVRFSSPSTMLSSIIVMSPGCGRPRQRTPERWPRYITQEMLLGPRPLNLPCCARKKGRLRCHERPKSREERRPMRAAIAGALPHIVSRTPGSSPQLHAGDHRAYEGLGISRSD